MNAPFLSILTIVCVMVFSNILPVSAQVDERCLMMVWPHSPSGITRNPDSIRVDTCSNSPTRGMHFGRQWFCVTFEFRAIKLPPTPHNDTIVEVSWQAIDTAYPTIRSGFQQLEQTFGSYALRKDGPAETDTTHVTSRTFSLRFDNLVVLDSVMRRLLAIPYTSAYYRNQSVVLLGVIPGIGVVEQPVLSIVLDAAGQRLHVMIKDTPQRKGVVALYTYLGECVSTAELQATADGVEADIKTDRLADGIYFIRYGSVSTSIMIRR